MNKNEDNNGTVNAVETVVKKQRGRPANPNAFRTIRLDANNRPMGKGASKIGSTVKCVDVQRSVKNSEFNYSTTSFANERTMTIPARAKANKPRKAKTAVTVTKTSPQENPETETVNTVTNPLTVVA
jgi:hypothetical protein